MVEYWNDFRPTNATMTEFYCTYEDIRQILGIEDIAELPDETLGNLRILERATCAVMRDLQIAKRHEIPDQVTTDYLVFRAKCRPISDVTGDRVVNGDDIVFKVWTDWASEPHNYSTLTVSDVNPISGYITLSTPCDDTYDHYEIDYNYQKFLYEWELIREAAALWGAYLYLLTEGLLMPDRFAFGSIRVQKNTSYIQVRNRYWETLDRIRSRPVRRRAYKRLTVPKVWHTEEQDI